MRLSDDDLNNMNSKELIRNLFERRELPQVPFIPLVWSFAAKMRQVTVEEMATNPTLLANALSDAQKLLGYDAIITSFDPSLEAEALGCRVEWMSEFEPPTVVSHPLREGKGITDLDADFVSKGRVPIVLEAAKRLNTVLGKQVAIIGVVTGPFTLGLHLQGESVIEELEKGTPDAKKTMDFARKCSQALIRSYCDLGIDTVMVIEGMPDKMEEATCKQIRGACQSMWNVLRYFKGFSMLLAHGCREDNVEVLCSLGADAVIVGRMSEAVCIDEPAKRNNLCLAEVVPTQDLISPDYEAVKSKVRDTLEGSCAKSGFFLSNEWEVPYAASPQTFLEVMKVVREFKMVDELARPFFPD